MLRLATTIQFSINQIASGRNWNASQIKSSDLQAIRAREQAATKGPWRWDVNLATHSVHLETEHSGRIYIMGFRRWGTQQAQPTFQDFKNHVVLPIKDWAIPRFAHHPDFDMDIDHPDARFISHARQDIPDLLNEIDRRQQQVQEMRNCDNCKNKSHILECVLCYNEEGFVSYDRGWKWEGESGK